VGSICPPAIVGSTQSWRRALGCDVGATVLACRASRASNEGVRWCQPDRRCCRVQDERALPEIETTLPPKWVVDRSARAPARRSVPGLAAGLNLGPRIRRNCLIAAVPQGRSQLGEDHMSGSVRRPLAGNERQPRATHGWGLVEFHARPPVDIGAVGGPRRAAGSATSQGRPQEARSPASPPAGRPISSTAT